MEEKKKIKLPWSIESVIAVLFIIISGVYFIAFDVKQNNVWDKCTSETEAYLVDEYVEEYLYAPYHGGKVQIKYNTHLTYRVDFRTESYTIKISRPGKKIAALTLPVKFNPDDNSMFFYNTTALDYIIGDDEEWIYHECE